MVAGWDDEGEIDLLEWFAELTIYTSSACLIGTRFRQRARRALRRALPRPRAGHRRHRLRRPLRRHRELPPPRRGPRWRWSSWSRGSWTAGPPGRRPPRRSATCSTCSCRSSDEDGSPRFSADEVTGMFISMMFAGHHTTSGTAAWTLIELLRHPDELAAVDAELDELYADGCRGQLPGAARDAPAGVGHQGGAAPPPAADPAAAGGQGGPRGRRLRRSPPARWWRPARRCPTASPRTSPSPTPSAGPLPRAARGGPGQPVDLDPLRRRPPPLRGRGLRHDAAQGHLLGAPRGLGVRAGPTARTRYRNDHSKMVVQLQQPCVVRYRRRAAAQGAPA